MLVYNLNNQINFTIIQRDVIQLIEKFKSSGSQEIPLLYIDLKTVAYDDTSIIPKLEYTGDCST